MSGPQYAWCPACRHSERIVSIRPGRLVGSIETQDTTQPVNEPCNVVRLQCGHSIAQKLEPVQEAG